MNSDPYLIPHIKITQSGTKFKAQNFKISKRKHRNTCDLWFRQITFRYNTKSTIRKRKHKHNEIPLHSLKYDYHKRNW